LHPVLQTLGFAFGGVRYLEACRRRFGDMVFMRTLFDSGFVMIFDPALVKQVFQGPHEQLNAGEANSLLGPVLGERSVLLLDGAEHLRHRRLMLPQFHGRRMQDYVDAMREAADLEIDSWPVGEPFTLLPRMQAITLRVIIRAVFGYEAGPAADELSRRLRAMIDPVARPRGLALLSLLERVGGGRRATARFEVQRAAVDELIYAEIERRRALTDLSERTDVFSALLLAVDEDGARLSDREVRDELMTLLLAGHETTATGLAWTFDLLLHAPGVLTSAREAAVGAGAREAATDAGARDGSADADEGDGDGGGAYLDAVVKEALRIRPVIPAVGRVVRGAPFPLGAYEIPPGMEINPSIRVIHRRGDLYPQPFEFSPERFLGPDAPDTYTWIPFGGGTRRCLGASFALMEMRIVLARVLERASLRAVDPELDEIDFRGITLAPKRGVRVLLDRAPRPAPISASASPSAA
jgi:cytochrome P450